MANETRGVHPCFFGSGLGLVSVDLLHWLAFRLNRLLGFDLHLLGVAQRRALRHLAEGQAHTALCNHLLGGRDRHLLVGELRGQLGVNGFHIGGGNHLLGDGVTRRILDHYSQECFRIAVNLGQGVVFVRRVPENTRVLARGGVLGNGRGQLRVFRDERAAVGLRNHHGGDALLLHSLQ